MRICYKANIQEITKFSNDIGRTSKQEQSIFFMYSLKMIRACLVHHFYDKKSIIITEKESKFLSNFYKFINQFNIKIITKKIEECLKNIQRNANSKIMFYQLSLELMREFKRNRKFVE